MPGEEGLLASIEDFSCPRCGAERRWRLAGKLRRRDNSLTAYIRCGVCGEPAFLKQVRAASETAAAADAERIFSIAQTVHRRFAPHGEFGAAAALRRNGATLVFAFVAGASPTGALRHAPVLHAADLASRMGRWLAMLHQCTDEEEPARAAISSTLEARSCALEERWRVESGHRPELATGLAALATWTRCAEARHGPIVRQHGDAKPDNFLYDGHRLVGIDIEGRHWNLPENDLAQLDVQLRLDGLSPIGRFDASRMRCLSAALTDGYSRHAAVDRPSLTAHRWLYLMGFWASRRAGSRLWRWRWDPVFARLVEALKIEDGG